MSASHKMASVIKDPPVFFKWQVGKKEEHFWNEQLANPGEICGHRFLAWAVRH